MLPMITPSCPAFVVHDDDAFRKSLIASLDQKHFTVTYSPDGDAAVELLRSREYRIVLLGLDLASKKGMHVLEFLRANRERVRCALIIIGDPSPELRAFARDADETLLKPVDADYVADRARAYCNR
jgi:DNA-binding response OmpR family regulator